MHWDVGWGFLLPALPGRDGSRNSGTDTIYIREGRPHKLRMGYTISNKQHGQFFPKKYPPKLGRVYDNAHSAYWVSHRGERTPNKFRTRFDRLESRARNGNC